MSVTESRKTAACKVVADAGGGRVFCFCCDISGELLYASEPIWAETAEQALAEAQKAVELNLINGYAVLPLTRDTLKAWLAANNKQK